MIHSRLLITYNLRNYCIRASPHLLKMSTDTTPLNNNQEQTITEGLATIKTTGKVFYNPVQEFNRDLSISVLTAFVKNCKTGKRNNKNNCDAANHEAIIPMTAGVKCEDGITILEALAATGLRSIRYAKEVPGIKQIIANDLSDKAVESIKMNIKENNVDNLVTAGYSNATMLMYQHRRENQFDAIDLDPYGCPSTFLDSAVQAIKEGGLLLVTSTDMAVLAGNAPETCYSKYGAVSLSARCCHEMALRILLQCIESHANRYGRYIQPMLSISADFYIRVFVRVFTGPYKCKYTLSKLSTVRHCKACDSFTLQPLGAVKKNEKNKQDKFVLPSMVGGTADGKCEHCGHPLHLGGPIWSAPIHSPEFVGQILREAPTTLATYRRIEGILNVVLEELVDCPLYYTLERLCSTLHVETPPMLTIRSAILNAGYQVSYSHVNKTSVKTTAPSRVVWDIMRCWESSHPASRKRLTEGAPATNILAVKPEREHSFRPHSDANPLSKQKGYVRFQENPLPYWGPGTRATAMIGKEKMSKSKLRQGKRKRKSSEEKSD